MISYHIVRAMALLSSYWYLITNVRHRGSLFVIVVGLCYFVRETCPLRCSVLRRDVKLIIAVNVYHYHHNSMKRDSIEKPSTFYIFPERLTNLAIFAEIPIVAMMRDLVPKFVASSPKKTRGT